MAEPDSHRRPPKRVAFVTCSDGPDLSADDWLAARACDSRGICVEAAAWDLERDWRSFHLVVLRTTWNYHLHATAFVDWLTATEAAGIPIWNPSRIISWNMDKKYLLELAALGFRVPETVIVPKHSEASLSDIVSERGWTAAVTKPAISANAYRTARVTLPVSRDAQQAFEVSLKERDMMVQRFVPEISAGELSLIFFRGEFSHAVKKKPAHGEFRVQEHHGGTIERYAPPSEMIRSCEQILASIPGPALYIRIDVIQTRDGFVIVEIEAIEPSLYLAYDPGAAERFARAISDTLG